MLLANSGIAFIISLKSNCLISPLKLVTKSSIFFFICSGKLPPNACETVPSTAFLTASLVPGSSFPPAFASCIAVPRLCSNLRGIIAD